MKGKPALDDFLSGGAADLAEGTKPAKKSQSVAQATQVNLPRNMPEPTVQKNLRIKWSAAQKLKDAAANRSRSEGKRITETEILEELIDQYLDSN